MAMDTYAFHHAALEAQRRMQEARHWAANERLLRQAGVRRPLITQFARWTATAMGRLRKAKVTTRVAPMQCADTQTGPLII